MNIKGIIMMVVSVVVVIIMITSVAIPILSSISDKETFNTGYDDQLRYREISPDVTIDITFEFVDGESHLNINGVDYTRFLENDSQLYLLMTDTGYATGSLQSSGGILSIIRFWNPEQNDFDGSTYIWPSNHTFEININNNTITFSGYNLDGAYSFNHGYVLDIDGKFGIYESVGDTNTTISASPNDVIIQYADHDILFDLISISNGSILSQYGYYAGVIYSDEINASVSAIQEDGLIKYMMPAKSSQAKDSSVYSTIGPISVMQGSLDPSISSLISIIPLIMILGLVIAAVSAFITLKSRGGGA